MIGLKGDLVCNLFLRGTSPHLKLSDTDVSLWLCQYSQKLAGRVPRQELSPGKKLQAYPLPDVK